MLSYRESEEYYDLYSVSSYVVSLVTRHARLQCSQEINDRASGSRRATALNRKRGKGQGALSTGHWALGTGGWLHQDYGVRAVRPGSGFHACRVVPG